MRRYIDRYRLLHLAAILGFVLGQWFAVIHATEHELSADNSDYCQTCAVAHAAGGPPAPLAIPATLAPQGAAPTQAAVEAVILRPIARPRNRGPPLFLV